MCLYIMQLSDEIASSLSLPNITDFVLDIDFLSLVSIKSLAVVRCF